MIANITGKICSVSTSIVVVLAGAPVSSVGGAAALCYTSTDSSSSSISRAQLLLTALTLTAASVALLLLFDMSCFPHIQPLKCLKLKSFHRVAAVWKVSYQRCCPGSQPTVWVSVSILLSLCTCGISWGKSKLKMREFSPRLTLCSNSYFRHQYLTHMLKSYKGEKVRCLLFFPYHVTYF